MSNEKLHHGAYIFLSGFVVPDHFGVPAINTYPNVTKGREKPRAFLSFVPHHLPSTSQPRSASAWVGGVVTVMVT